jgi:hypothetical protein
VKSTTDNNEILALEADVVLFTPRPMDREQIDADVIALLESGKNVISTESHHFPRLGGVDYEQRFVKAGRAGEATVGRRVEAAVAPEAATVLSFAGAGGDAATQLRRTGQSPQGYAARAESAGDCPKS